HLTARTIGKRPGIELDVAAILDAAERTRCGLEINCALPRLDVPVELLHAARDRDIVFVFTSDAHHAREFDRMQWGPKQACRGWLPAEKVANTWSRDRFLAWVGDKRAS
ncbi:MAG: DNA polymerase/3'-5' exonuclease PolX, partial [Myxococcota bacterium]